MTIERGVRFPTVPHRDAIEVYFPGVYTSKWGISDFYPEVGAKIADILRSDDDVFFELSAKKEIQYANVYRDHGDTYIDAYVATDYDSDIIFDMLEEAYPDMEYEELHPMVEEIMSVMELDSCDEWDGCPYFHETAKMTGHVSMDEFKAVLNKLIEKAEQRGHWYYNSLVNITRDYIDHRNHKEADAE